MRNKLKVTTSIRSPALAKRISNVISRLPKGSKRAVKIAKIGSVKGTSRKSGFRLDKIKSPKPLKVKKLVSLKSIISKYKTKKK